MPSNEIRSKLEKLKIEIENHEDLICESRFENDGDDLCFIIKPEYESTVKQKIEQNTDTEISILSDYILESSELLKIVVGYSGRM